MRPAAGRRRFRHRGPLVAVKLESRLGLAADIGADNVGRKQIQGALHARELPASERANARASAVLPTPG